MSEWKTIDSEPYGYAVSDEGEVSRNGEVRKTRVNPKGYVKVSIGGKDISVHRLVANHFIPNPNGYKEVNHINGVKDDNRAENLEWCTRSENMKHAYALGLHPGVKLSGTMSPNFGRNGSKHPQSMAVMATFLDGSTKTYESQGLAEKDGFSPCKISSCINGQRKSHRGATWMPLPAPPTIISKAEKV